MAIGGALYQGNSGLVAGPLGVVKVGFNGFDMGKTVSDATLEVMQNIKDITYQQDGTMPADKVRTGIIYQLKVSFGEISTGLLNQIMNGVEMITNDVNSDGAVITRSMYSSQRENESAPLRIAKVDSNGSESDLDQDVMNFYTAICNIEGAMINWGADTQREVAATFDIYWDEFATGESTTYDGAFGYYGDPIVADVPAVVWPDREGPYVVSAETFSATVVHLQMQETTALVTGPTPEERVVLIVDGDYVVPSAVIINIGDDTIVDVTVATITTGQVLAVCLLPGVFEDTETVPNESGRLVDFSVTNNV